MSYFEDTIGRSHFNGSIITPYFKVDTSKLVELKNQRPPGGLSRSIGKMCYDATRKTIVTCYNDCWC